MTSATTGEVPVTAGERRGAAGTAALGLIGAALYADWVLLEPIVGRDLSPVRSYVSELAALSHPHHVVVNRLDVVSGVCLLLFTRGLLSRLPSPAMGIAQRWGGAGLATFGFTTAVNGIFPMTCAPSLQPRCPAGGLALLAPLQDKMATALSIAAVLGVLVSMGALGRALREAPGWRGAARAGSRLFSLTAPLTVIVGLLGLLDHDVGAPQRALIVLHASWIVVLAVAVLRLGTATPDSAAASGAPLGHAPPATVGGDRRPLERRSAERAAPAVSPAAPPQPPTPSSPTVAGRPTVRRRQTRSRGTLSPHAPRRRQ